MIQMGFSAQRRLQVTLGLLESRDSNEVSKSLGIVYGPVKYLPAVFILCARLRGLIFGVASLLGGGVTESHTSLTGM